MKKTIPLITLLLFTTPSFAQNGGVNWGLPTAPVAGSFVCSLNTIPGQIVSCGTGTIPVVTGTGTPTITTGSTDGFGEVTAGASAISVVITFSSVKTNAPFCTVTNQGPTTALPTYTISTSAITITQVATSGNKFDYFCAQR